MSRRATKTAAELMAELQADRSFVEQRAVREAEQERRAAAWREAEAPLVAQLRAAGLAVDSVWDLVNTTAPYPEVLGLLLEHLAPADRYPDRVREGIARALAVPEASFAADTLQALYAAEPAETDAKQGLAVALATAAAERSNALAALAADPAHGSSRALLLAALEDHPATLEALAGDPEIGEEARRRLRRR